MKSEIRLKGKKLKIVLELLQYSHDTIPIPPANCQWIKNPKGWATGAMLKKAKVVGQFDKHKYLQQRLGTIIETKELKYLNKRK